MVVHGSGKLRGLGSNPTAFFFSMVLHSRQRVVNVAFAFCVWSFYQSYDYYYFNVQSRYCDVCYYALAF